MSKSEVKKIINKILHHISVHLILSLCPDFAVTDLYWPRTASQDFTPHLGN
jgi:hypothetical protein